MGRKRRDRNIAMNQCIKIFRMLDEERPPRSIVGPWRRTFNRICADLGFDKKSARILWSSIGVYDNWDHLHENDTERRQSVSEWREMFAYDLRYCSDRWTFDRLLRVQWTFRHWERAWHYTVNGTHWFDPIE